MSQNVYVLEKKDNRFKNVWIRQGIYSTYKSAQSAFIYKDGLFRILKEELQ